MQHTILVVDDASLMSASLAEDTRDDDSHFINGILIQRCQNNNSQTILYFSHNHK